jgi:hypothetical protein
MVETLLAAEVRALPNALWLLLGPKPTAALHHLVHLGMLRSDHVPEGIEFRSASNVRSGSPRSSRPGIGIIALSFFEASLDPLDAVKGAVELVSPVRADR